MTVNLAEIPVGLSVFQRPSITNFALDFVDLWHEAVIAHGCWLLMSANIKPRIDMPRIIFVFTTMINFSSCIYHFRDIRTRMVFILTLRERAAFGMGSDPEKSDGVFELISDASYAQLLIEPQGAHSVSTLHQRLFKLVSTLITLKGCLATTLFAR
jgi:hypothetical protein